MLIRVLSLFVVGLLVLATPLHAQEKIGTSGPGVSYRGGWTITPSFGFAETYDDNISLFGVNTAENQNDDYIATYFPAVDLHYAGKHTRFGADYSGSFLSYQTFTLLNRWDQHLNINLKRQETARLSWFAHGNAAALPSTEAIELGGIPYRHTGAKTLDSRGGVEYVFSARDSLVTTLNYQRVAFDRPADVRVGLRGGDVAESLNVWRHKINSRLATGADYSFRRARVVGDPEPFNIHTAEGAIDYELSPSWSFSGGGGVVYTAPTLITPARTGPAWRLAFERHQGATTFHVGYLRSFIPSFGYGGTVQNEEAGIGFHTPLFNSRHWYTDNSLVYRDNEPLTNTVQQLPLRSLRTYSVIGWTPQGWVRVEGFYSRVQQTSLRVGGQIYRNRFGFQIVTSKPMRVQ